MSDARWSPGVGPTNPALPGGGGRHESHLSLGEIERAHREVGSVRARGEGVAVAGHADGRLDVSRLLGQSDVHVLPPPSVGPCAGAASYVMRAFRGRVKR